MAGKKKAAVNTEADAPVAAENEKALDGAKPLSTDAGIPTFRADLGESLPPQPHPGVE